MENKVRDKEVLVSFPAGSVTLKPGSMFYEAQEKMAEFLKKTDDDQMLYNFRAAAGLDTTVSYTHLDVYKRQDKGYYRYTVRFLYRKCLVDSFHSLLVLFCSAHIQSSFV